MTIDIIQTLEQKNYDSTPEKRLWVSVLITFVDDIIYFSRQKSNYKHNKRFLQEKAQWLKETPSNKKMDWAQREVNKILSLAKDKYIKTICELISIDYDWFFKCLEDLSKNPQRSRLKIDLNC